MKASRNPCAEVFYKDSCKQHFIDLNILTLPCLYIYCTIIFLIQHDNKLLTTDNIHNHDVRCKSKIRTDLCKVNKWSHGPMSMGIKFYNKLPHHIKIQTGITFKNDVKQFLIEKCFYSIDQFLNS